LAVSDAFAALAIGAAALVVLLAFAVIPEIPSRRRLPPVVGPDAPDALKRLDKEIGHFRLADYATDRETRKKVDAILEQLPPDSGHTG
jgi:hypothetical protein